MTESKFTVQEAYTRDVGRGVIRIDKNTMDDIVITTGDVVEIVGKQRAVAKCLPLYPADEGKKIIRIDGLIQNNCQSQIGNSVVIKKINASFAGSVMVLPLESIPPIDARYIADALESMPVIPEQLVMVPYFGGRLTFKVVATIPEITDDVKAVLITQKTVFGILEKKLTSDSPDQSIEDERYSVLQKIWTVEKLSNSELESVINRIRELHKLLHEDAFRYPRRDQDQENEN